jgi:hypothetical protein
MSFGKRKVEIRRQLVPTLAVFQRKVKSELVSVQCGSLKNIRGLLKTQKKIFTFFILQVQVNQPFLRRSNLVRQSQRIEICRVFGPLFKSTVNISNDRHTLLTLQKQSYLDSP